VLTHNVRPHRNIVRAKGNQMGCLELEPEKRLGD